MLPARGETRKCLLLMTGVSPLAVASVRGMGARQCGLRHCTLQPWAAWSGTPLTLGFPLGRTRITRRFLVLGCGVT